MRAHFQTGPNADNTLCTAYRYAQFGVVEATYAAHSGDPLDTSLKLQTGCRQSVGVSWV